MAEVPPQSVVSETPNPKANEPEAPNPKAESATPTPEEKLPATTPVPAVEPEPHLGLVKVTLPGGKEIYVPQKSIQMPPTQPETGHKRTAPSLGSQTSDIKEEAVEYGDVDPAARAALTQKVKLFDIKRSRRLDPSEGLIQDMEVAGPNRPSFEVTPPSQEGETFTELKAANCNPAISWNSACPSTSLHTGLYPTDFPNSRTSSP